MSIRKLTLLCATAMVLAACSNPSTNAAQTNTSKTSGGAIEEAVRQKIHRGFEIRGENLQFTDGKLVLKKDGKDHGTIAADGTLIIDGKDVALTPAQRELTKRLHAQGLQLSEDAVSIAGDAAGVASTAVSEGIKMAMSSVFKGEDPAREAEFERKIEETVTTRIKPGALKMCNTSNQMHETKRQLANVVPEYKPYFEDREPCDVAELEKDLSEPSSPTSADRPSSAQ